MYILGTKNHKKANAVWKELLNGKPNGARTLGAAIEKLSDYFEPYYDMLITYASDIEFEMPKDVKKIAVIWHQNYPWASGITSWRKVNKKLKGYDVHYFCNEEHIIELIKESKGKAFYLPRFIDTKSIPIPKGGYEIKYIPTLWFGNRWNEFGCEFENYKKNEKPYWISQGMFGKGDKEITELTREEALEVVASTRKVWAIGISQLEAKYLGAEIVSYRGEEHPYYDQNTIKKYLKELLSSINKVGSK